MNEITPDETRASIGEMSRGEPASERGPTTLVIEQVALARKPDKLMRQNLALALFYNCA